MGTLKAGDLLGIQVGRQPLPPTDRQTVWLEHVRACRPSDLSRTAYCQCPGLELRSFHRWVAQLRQTFRRPTSTGPDPT